MSTYRFLQDHYVGTAYFPAGTVASTSDVGGVLPANWVPSANVDPLDAAAVNAFYAAGPKLTGLVRQQWAGIPVAPPTTYWKQTTFPTGPTSWQLTGLGAGLAAIFQ